MALLHHPCVQLHLLEGLHGSLVATLSRSESEISESAKAEGSSTETLFELVVRPLVPSPAVVVLDEAVGLSWLDTVAVGAKVLEIDLLEVVVFLLVEVGQLPEDTDILERQVVPLIVVRVVGHLVVVDVLTSAEDTSDLHELTLVHVVGSHALVLEVKRNPATVHDNGGTLNVDAATLTGHESLHARLTTLITIQRVDNRVAFLALIVLLGNEDLLGGIELANDVVRLEPVIHIVLLLGHAPPGEIELLPGRDVRSDFTEAVVSLGSEELLSDAFTIVPVSNATGEHH